MMPGSEPLRGTALTPSKKLNMAQRPSEKAPTSRCITSEWDGTVAPADAFSRINRHVIPACLYLNVCKQHKVLRRENMQFSGRHAFLAQAMEITRLCLCWQSGMGKIFSLFVKIPIHAVEDLFPIL